MADDLTDEELELLEQHRAAKRKPRAVRVRAKHDSGAEVSKWPSSDGGLSVRRSVPTRAWVRERVSFRVGGPSPRCGSFRSSFL